MGLLSGLPRAALPEAQATMVGLQLTQAPKKPEGMDFAGGSAWDVSPPSFSLWGSTCRNPKSTSPRGSPTEPEGRSQNRATHLIGLSAVWSAAVATGVGTYGQSSSDGFVIFLDAAMVQGLL